jgi:hypothetical protein
MKKWFVCLPHRDKSWDNRTRKKGNFQKQAGLALATQNTERSVV